MRDLLRSVWRFCVFGLAFLCSSSCWPAGFHLLCSSKLSASSLPLLLEPFAQLNRLNSCLRFGIWMKTRPQQTVGYRQHTKLLWHSMFYVSVSTFTFIACSGNIQDLLHYSGVKIKGHILNMHHISSCFHTEDVRALVQILFSFSFPLFPVLISTNIMSGSSSSRLILVFCPFALLTSDVLLMAFQWKCHKARNVHFLNFDVWLLVFICCLGGAAEKE